MEHKNLSFTVQKDTEMVHWEVKGGTKITCFLKENGSEFSEERRPTDLVKKHSEHQPSRHLRSSDSESQDDRDDPTDAIQCQMSWTWRCILQLEADVQWSRRVERGSRYSVTSAAEDSRDALRRAEDLCRNQERSRTEHCGRSCGDATTGACDSEGTENGGCPNASVHWHDRRCPSCEATRTAWRSTTK